VRKERSRIDIYLTIMDYDMIAGMHYAAALAAV